MSRHTPACLPPENEDYAGKTASVFGWGQTKDQALCRRYGSQVLMETTETIMTNQACEKLSGTAQVCKNLVIIEVITEEKTSMAGRLTADMVCGIKQEQAYASATVEDQLLWMWKDSTPLSVLPAG